MKPIEMIKKQPEFKDPEAFWNWHAENTVERNYSEHSIKELAELHENVLKLATNVQTRELVIDFLCFWYYPVWSSRAGASYIVTLVDYATGKITEEKAMSTTEEGWKFRYNNPDYLDAYCDGFSAFLTFDDYKNTQPEIKEIVDEIFEADSLDKIHDSEG